MTSPRLFGVVLAIVMAIAGLPVRAALASGGSIAHCCCGPHAAADNCGCPDCPAAHDGASDDDDHPPADGTPRIQACSLELRFAIVNAPSWLQPVAIRVPVREEQPRSLAAPPAPQWLPQVIPAPPTPPPD